MKLKLRSATILTSGSGNEKSCELDELIASEYKGNAS